MVDIPVYCDAQGEKAANNVTDRVCGSGGKHIEKKKQKQPKHREEEEEAAEGGAENKVEDPKVLALSLKYPHRTPINCILN